MSKQNRISILIDKFMRVNEDVSLEGLAVGDIPLIQDMVLDNPYGKPHIRGGIEEVNSNSTTNVMGKMIDVKSQDGTNYMLAGMNLRISRSVGGVWTDVKTGLTSSSDNGYFRHTAFGDDIIITNKIDKPFRLTGDDLSTTTEVELAKPDIDAVIMQREKNVLAGNLLDASSVYLYMMVYVTSIGERSNPSNPIMFINASPSIPISTNSDHTRLYLDNLPVPTDARVTSKWLFRTEGWDRADDIDGSIFYLLKKMDIDVIDFEDNVADSALDFGESIKYSRVPDKAQHVIQSNNRLWFGNMELHKKSFIEGWVTAKSNGGDQTPTTIVYEDGLIQSGGQSHLTPRTDTPYGGGGGGLGGLRSARYYQYMYVYEDVNGFESEPSYGEVFLSGGTLGNFRDIELSTLGVGGIGANDFKSDPNLKFRNIYRTLGEINVFTTKQKPFQLVIKENIQHDSAPTGGHPNTTYDYADSLADEAKDSGLGLGATYVEFTKNGKSAVAWSQADRPAYFLAENIRNVFRDDQDEVTGLVDDGNGVLIFKENSIVKLYHTGASQNWYLRKVWAEFGCDEPKSLKKAGNTIYFRHNKRPYSYVSGGAPTYIGFGKQATLDTLTVRDVDVSNKWVIWMMETTSNNREWMIVYDMVLKTWYQFTMHVSPTEANMKTVMVKKYDDFLVKGDIYLGKQKLFHYDESSFLDDYTGSALKVTVKIQLPRIKLDGITQIKLRDLVMSFRRVNSEDISIAMVTEDEGFIAETIPTGDGVIRITGQGDRPVTSTTMFYDLTFTGGLRQLDVLRADLRVKKLGVA